MSEEIFKRKKNQHTYLQNSDTGNNLKANIYMYLHVLILINFRTDVFVKQKCPIMANSKDGLGHNHKYLDTSRKILSLEMIMCDIKTLISII